MFIKHLLVGTGRFEHMDRAQLHNISQHVIGIYIYIWGYVLERPTSNIHVSWSLPKSPHPWCVLKVVDGVNYCHDHMVAHRDLKSGCWVKRGDYLAVEQGTKGIQRLHGWWSGISFLVCIVIESWIFRRYGNLTKIDFENCPSIQ